MKLKKIILLSLAAVVLLGAIAGTWLYFSQPKTSNNTWTYALKRSALTRFASTENGCYFLTNDTILHFYDYETKVTVPLCSKVACEHSDRTCDGYVDGVPGVPLCFINNHIYYVENWQNGSLIRRNATGGDVTTIGIPARKFVELQQAVAIEYYAPDGEYLYYSGSAENKENAETELEEIFFVGRIHLSSGKDEILFEETMDKTMEAVQLKAVKDGSCLFFCQKGMDIPSTDPNYSEELRNIPVGLYRWTEETGEITTVFEGLREQCENFYFVEGDWVYYNTMGNNKALLRGDNYRINIETGETEFICGNATLSYLGGSYALYKTGFEDYRLMDLNTKAFLPVDDDTGVSSAILNTYNEHVFILTFSETIEDSMVTTTSTTCMIRHDSLKNGLQAKDLIPIYLFSSSTKPVTDPTDPTDPADPDAPKPSFDYPPVDYEAEFTIPETGLNASVQYLPETVENPDNLPVLKWVCIMNGKQTWTEDAVHELNQMLADRKMPYRVQFVMLTGDAYLYTEWFSQPEAQELLKDADLIYAWMTPENQKEYLMPITEHVTGDAQPTLKNAVVHELNWTGGMVDGEIYGIQAYPRPVNSHGWQLKPDVLSKYGLTEEDFHRNYWEMDEIFEKIYKANGNKPFLYEEYEGYERDNLSRKGVLATSPSALSGSIKYLQQNIGLTFGIDVSSGTPKVVNKLETETARKIQEAILRYKDAGYTTGPTKETGFDEIQIFYNTTIATEGYSDSNYQYIPLTDTVFNNAYASYQVNGVSSITQYKEHAVSLLNLIGEDAEFRHHLLFGKEGRDYTFTDGNYKQITQDDGAYYNMEFLSMYSVFDSVREKDTHLICYEGKTKLETYLECMDSVTFCYYPIVFDYSGLEAEVKEYARIYGDYCNYLTNHEVGKDKEGNLLPYIVHQKYIDDIMHEKKIPRMDTAAYDEMLQKLNDAGAQKIIAELQRQLDEWLAANPDWLEQVKPAS